MSYRGMVLDERAELVELLRGLSEQEWETPSLCAGWRVRDVVGHLLQDTLSPLGYAAVVVKSRGSVSRTNSALTQSFSNLTTEQLVDTLATESGRPSKLGPQSAL